MERKIEFSKHHPKLVLDLLTERYGNNLLVEFSIYEDRPGLIDDRRRVFSMPASEVTNTWIAESFGSLAPRNELALNSCVVLPGGVAAHIPMVDFSTQALAQTNKLQAVLPEKLFDKMIWFDSGRSFHGYGTELITPKQWVELMGRLLLANRPGFPAIVDPRWIGHRLIAGYSALRWSRNSRKYLQIPRVAIEPNVLTSN